MTLSNDPIHPISSLALAVRGFDSMTIVNPLISPPVTGYLDNYFGDGRDLIFLNPSSPGLAIAPGGSFNLPMVVLHSSSSNSVGTTSFEFCEECGPAASDLAGNPYPDSDVALHLVPEPASATLAAAALLALAALRTARRQGV